MASQIRLSICIATRNRAKYIGATIESIIPQLTPATELLIIDGASTDNTQELIQKYSQQTPALRYIRLAINGGVDKDYDLAAQYAQGEYCWLMTDDDVLEPYALGTVLKYLDESYDLLVINIEDYSVDLSRPLQRRNLLLIADKIYLPEQLESLFQELGYHLTYIGAVVIRRMVWITRNASRYYGSYFAHFGVIFQKRLESGACFVAQPLIRGRIGNISWGGHQFKIWMFSWPEIVWSFPHFSSISKQRITQLEPWRNPKALFVARGNGNYSYTEYSHWIKPRMSLSWQKLIAYLIAIFPMPLAWLSMYTYWSVTRPHAKTTLYDWTFAPSAQRWFRWLVKRQ